jgi:hypothetical protein
MSPAQPTLSFRLRFDHKLKLWVLVMGGWFPIQLAALDILVLDRNVLSALKSLRANPNRADLASDKWWLAQLDRPAPVLNPVLIAMEGNSRAVPTFDQFCAQLADAQEMLKLALPRATVLMHPVQHLNGVYQVTTSQESRMEREAAFLLKVCPLLTNRVGEKLARKQEAALLLAADQLGVARQGLCCIAALSLLYERVDGKQPMIGRGILKPHSGYTESDAYNALSDLRSLELLAAGSTLAESSSGLCTRDKSLALFWLALGVNNARWEGERFVADYTPKQPLFPRLEDAEVMQLMRRTSGAA